MMKTPQELPPNQRRYPMLKNEVLEKCIEIKGLFSNPKCWTQRVFSRNEKGYEVAINSPFACCYCLSGAISKVCNDLPGRTELYKSIYSEFVKDISDKLPYSKYVVPFNDGSTYEEVIALIDKTINRLQIELAQ